MSVGWVEASLQPTIPYTCCSIIHFIKEYFMLVDAILGLGSVSSSLNSVVDLYKNVSGIFKGDQKIQYLDKMTTHLGGIEMQLERLSDKIIVAPQMQIVQDVTKTHQQKIEDLKEVKTCLEPIQQAIDEEILSSAMILTPEKMQNALAKNPWEVLIDVRPIDSVTPPNNPDLVPVAFYHNGMAFIGWQMRGTLPILFDCQFDTLPTSPSKPVETKPKTGKAFRFEMIRVDAKGKIIHREPKQAQYEIEDLGNGVTLEMVFIPAGTFMMGSPENEKERYSSESPQHRVTVQPFLMSKYTVTQSQWQAMMGENPSSFKGKNRPVEKVSYDDVVKFCQRLSEKTGKAYRLPSEAEWEYACRAGTTAPFSFGETITTDLVNYNGNYPYASAPKGVYRGKTTDVGSFPPNAFGLYDMHGNVWEWCADPWHDNYEGANTDGSVWKESGDEGPVVLRGGSWNVIAWGGHARRSASGGRGLAVAGAAVFASPGSGNSLIFMLFPFFPRGGWGYSPNEVQGQRPCSNFFLVFLFFYRVIYFLVPKFHLGMTFATLRVAVGNHIGDSNETPFSTRSVEEGIPKQSLGTRKNSHLVRRRSVFYRTMPRYYWSLLPW
jgi:formylglycine-generating enzyme required for sulfatase activity